MSEPVSSSVDLSGLELPPQPAGMPLGAPDIPRYRIIRLIGEGGMGAVWEAEQRATRRIVALKVIRPGQFTPMMLKRFEHEVEILGRLKHAGIATIYEAGVAAGAAGPQPFFAMEYVRGVPLDRWLANTRPSIRQRLELLSRICDALQHAHQQGVIHRDLKPANILIDDSGQPKILDFGIACAAGVDLHTTAIRTHSGLLIGTLPYMSPEQASGEAHALDTRSDVYAMGVISYEMLVDRLPYDLTGKPLDEAVSLIRSAPGPALGRWNRSLRGDVETIVGKALQKEKDRRYSSVGDLSADIRRHLNYEPITARSPGALYQLSRFARRNKVLVAGLGAVALVLIIGMIATSIQLVRARRAERLAQQRFDDVRAMANTFMFDLHDRVQPLAGSTPAVQLLVQTSLKYLDKLADAAGSDPGLLRELAKGYGKMGDIQGNPNLQNLGDTRGALASYRRALEITKRLAAAHPHDPLLTHELAGAYLHVGQLLARTGNVDDALLGLQQATGVAREALKLSPTDAVAKRALLLCMGQTGKVLELANRYPDALEAHRQSEQLAGELVAAAPEDLRALTDLAATSNNVADVLIAGGQHAEALERYRRCLEIDQRLATLEPHSGTRQRALAIGHGKIAYALSQSGDHAGAIASLHKALAIKQELVRKDPSSATAQRDLMVGYNRIADEAVQLKDTPSALAYYQKGSEIIQRLAEQDPNDAEIERDRVLSHYQIGGAWFWMSREQGSEPARQLESLRRSRDAFDQCRKGLESLKQAGRLVPVDESYLKEVTELIRQIDSQSAAQEASLSGSSGTKPAQNRGKTP